MDQFQYQLLPTILPYSIAPYPYVTDNDLYINSYIAISGPPGPQGPEGPPGTPGLVPITIVTNTTYNANTTDYFLGVNITAPGNIVLPTSPIGTVFIVKDITGSATINTITITTIDSRLIDGSSSAIINTSFGGVVLVFNGVDWSIV